MTQNAIQTCRASASWCRRWNLADQTRAPVATACTFCLKVRRAATGKDAHATKRSAFRPSRRRRRCARCALDVQCAFGWTAQQTNKQPPPRPFDTEITKTCPAQRRCGAEQSFVVCGAWAARRRPRVERGDQRAGGNVLRRVVVEEDRPREKGQAARAENKHRACRHHPAQRRGATDEKRVQQGRREGSKGGMFASC